MMASRRPEAAARAGGRREKEHTINPALGNVWERGNGGIENTYVFRQLL